MEVVLRYVAKRAPFTLPPEVGKKIVDDSGGNLRKAILVLEALKMQSYAQYHVVIVPFMCHPTQTRFIRSSDHREAGLGNVLPQSSRPNCG